MNDSQSTRTICTLFIVLLMLLLTACQNAEAEPPAAAPQQESAPESSTLETIATAPIPREQGAAPIRLAIPALELTLPVEPMAWQMVEVDGTRTTEWIVPEDAVGWHVNSAGVGTVGNILLSGHQKAGDAVFAALALGEITPGEELLLTDENDHIVVYRVTEVSDPLPLNGATEAELAQQNGYVAPADGASLILITGWPEFTTTHRLFAVADFVGTVE